MYNQLHENLTERETKYKPLTIEERLMSLYRDNERTYVKCQCGCYIFRGFEYSNCYIFILFKAKVVNTKFLLLNDNNRCNHTQSDIDYGKKTKHKYIIIIH